jgi:hypothetical protein
MTITPDSFIEWYCRSGDGDSRGLKLEIGGIPRVSISFVEYVLEFLRDRWLQL